MGYQYRSNVLEELLRHGLKPLGETPPQKLRDAVLDLYKYEIRRLRAELLDGRIQKPDYAGHIINLRKRYRLLSLPVESWVVTSSGG